MSDELNRNFRRWQVADVSGQDDDADAAFRAVFASSVHESPISPGFTARTLEAVAHAASHDERRARRTRAAAVWGSVSGGVLLTYFGAGVVGSVAASALTGLLDLVVGVIVRLATAGGGAADAWSVLSSLGRAASAFAADPAVTITIVAIQAIAIAALVALQRVLGSDRESFK